jgi:hypothetical protein
MPLECIMMFKTCPALPCASKVSLKNYGRRKLVHNDTLRKLCLRGLNEKEGRDALRAISIIVVVEAVEVLSAYVQAEGTIAKSRCEVFRLTHSARTSQHIQTGVGDPETHGASFRPFSAAAQHSAQATKSPSFKLRDSINWKRNLRGSPNSPLQISCMGYMVHVRSMPLLSIV